MKPVVDDPNKDQTQIYLEYTRRGRGPNGGLILAVHDTLFLLKWLARANGLIGAIIEADRLTGCISKGATGKLISDKMAAYLDEFTAAMGGGK